MSASTGVGGHKPSLPAVPIGTNNSGGVPVSASQPKGSNTTQLSVPAGEVSSIGGPVLDNQTNDVQIVGGGRKRLSVVPYRKQLFVSRLTPETTTADVLRNSRNRQLDLVFVLDPSEVTVSRIDPLVVPEDRYPPTLELTYSLTFSN